MRRAGLLRALSSAALFGSAAPLTKELLRDLPTHLLAGLLYLGAALFVLPPLVASRSLGLRPDRISRELAAPSDP